MRTAVSKLVKADPAFGPVVEEFPRCPIGTEPVAPDTHFDALVRSVVSQQLSTTVARSISARLRQAFGDPLQAEHVATLQPEQLREMGLSGAKTKTILGLADAWANGQLDFEAAIEARDYEFIHDGLVALWGIGPWTVDMYLMFSLGALDVWPVGDLGVRRGWQVIHGLAEEPVAKDLAAMADHLKPYRSVAAWYCWRAVEPKPKNL